MARIAAEARVDEREWTLVFKAAGWQRALRASGYVKSSGHDKAEAKLELIEEMRRLNEEQEQEQEQVDEEEEEREEEEQVDEEDEEEQEDEAEVAEEELEVEEQEEQEEQEEEEIEEEEEAEVQVEGEDRMRTAVRKPASDSTSKTDAENNSSSIGNGRSSGTRGFGAGSHPRSRRSDAAAPRVSNDNTYGELREWRSSSVRESVVARKLDDFQGSSGAYSSSPSHQNSKRRRLVAGRAADSSLSSDRNPEQLWPSLSLKEAGSRVVGLLPAATGYRKDIVPAATDDGGYDSSTDDVPKIQDEVDNFVLHMTSSLVSITSLPVCIDGIATGGANPPEVVYVVGTVGPDRETFKERVETWRLWLDPMRRPQYLLKTESGSWIKLVRPHNSYAKIMCDVRALGYFLDFVKKLPHASTKAAENDLQKKCRGHGFEPTLDRLSRHIKVIRNFVEEDEELARAPLMRRTFPNLFIKRLRRDERHDSGSEWDTANVKRKAESTERQERYRIMAKKDVQKPKPSRASPPELLSDSDHRGRSGQTSKAVRREDVRDLDRIRQTSNGVQPWVQRENVREAEERPGPSKEAHKRIFTQAELNVEDPPICILCDDGGNLLYCDGPCHRHFHPTKESGEGSTCETLGLADADVKAMGKYYCPNCKHKEQQCFICGDLGPSVRSAGCAQEVRRCDVSFCKRYFHVDCAAELLCASSDRDWTNLANAIHDGSQKLYCPRHCCLVCGEANMDEPGMLVQCRRCPKAWHRRCLQDFSRSKELTSTVIWNHHDRDFIYCREHAILPNLQTPARNHVRFPDAA